MIYPGQVGAPKRQRQVEKVARELPKPLGKVTGAGGNTGSQGKWASRPTIADEEGLPMDRGGEEALREMSRQANELLVEKLGNQMHVLFTAMTPKQEKCNRKLREKNLAIRKQMLELEKEKMQHNNRVELLMTAMLRQVGGAPLPSQAADQKMTPERGGRPTGVADQAAAFRRVTAENAPGTQPKQARPGVVTRQAAAASGPGGQLRYPADTSGTPPAVRTGGLDAQEVAELVRRSQVMEGALRDVLTTWNGAGALKGFLQARGHEEVVGWED